MVRCSPLWIRNTGADHHDCVGKQWHQTKSAFRPRSNQTSFEKRAAERIALAAIKAKEKGMKDEKEAERQVCGGQHTGGTLTDQVTASYRSDPHETHSKGGTRTFCEDGGEDAQEAR
jgi:hypothetical protein